MNEENECLDAGSLIIFTQLVVLCALSERLLLWQPYVQASVENAKVDKASQVPKGQVIMDCDVSSSVLHKCHNYVDLLQE